MALKQCSMCDRTFTKLEHVKRHERSHTRERPYECPTCKKHFSRSDVLFRHSKGHSQTALNRMKDDEQSHQEYRDFDDIIRPSMSRIEAGQNPAEIQQVRREPCYSPASRRRRSQVSLMNSERQYSHLSSPSHPRSSTRMHPASPGEHQIEALINAAHHLEPTASTPWRSPSPMGFSRSEHTYTVGRNQDSMGPPIDPAIDVLSFAPAPAEHVSSLDQWAFELVQSNNPVPNRTPADALQTWLFPLESELHHTAADNFFDQDAFRNASENQVSPTGSSISIASRVPRERFQRVQNCWPSRERTSSRLMPDLWQSITSSDCANMLSELPQDYTETPLSERERRISRWGLDEECRSMLQKTLSQNPISSDSFGETVYSGGETATSSLPADIQFPPSEILDIALEMYLYYFHPTLPIIHIPTFSAKHAPQTLLLCICLIGMSILGTSGATKFVTQIFPGVLQLVITEFQSLSSTNHSPHRQMRIIATSLLALNLASITGRKSRIAQAETLYVELITLAQNQGLFCANEGAKIDLLLDGIVDIEAKWKAWAKVECGKRIIFGLIEADCWWAGYLSTSPLIRPDAVQILPPSDYSLFHINSAMKWIQLVQRGARHHPHGVTPLHHLTPGLQLDASSFRSLLTLTLLRIYESNDRLAPATGSQRHLEPWRIYFEDQRSHDILPLLVNLSSSSIDALRTADLNSAVLWHSSCMLLGANIRYFELAAGRSGPEPAVNALEDISMWSQTPSARRSVLHAAQIYKLLFDRKVSDIVNPLSVVALFHAALILGLYIFTLPPTITCDMNDNCIELLDLINWVSVGQLGLTDTPPSTSPHNFNLSDTHSSLARNFIRHGGPFSITGIALEGGYLAARRTLLHCADLMEGIGRWKSHTFSQILHIMSDDLTDYDGPDEEDA